MIGRAAFRLPDGRQIQPLAVANWSKADGPDYGALPPMIRHMGGEWPCVPFGKPGPPPLPSPWPASTAAAMDTWPHGYGANHEWSLVSHGAGEIVIAIDYPETHPVRRLRRSIRGIPGRAAIGIGLDVDMRADWDLCLALHPIFRLPDAVGAMEVVIEDARAGRTYPVAPDETSLVQPDAGFAGLDAVPASGGGALDLAHLPLATADEELVQVVSSAGRVVLRNRAEGYAATLGYDARLFPTILLWVANGGLAGYPWNGSFRALGVEPARAAFDLGQEVSAHPGNPWRRAGVPTSIRLAAGERLSTRYAIGVEAL